MEKITLDSIIKKEWIKEIVDYQEDLDSEAIREYGKVMKSSAGQTFRQLAEKIFKKIYPGEFPDKQLEKIMYDEYVKGFNNNLIDHLNSKLS